MTTIKRCVGLAVTLAWIGCSNTTPDDAAPNDGSAGASAGTGSSVGPGGGGNSGASGASAGTGSVAVGGPANAGASGSQARAGSGGAPAAGEATLVGSSAPSCQVYCMTDADCCEELGFGDRCPSRNPERALCEIDLESGWDHVCRSLAGACADDAECQADDPDTVCAENAPYWCSASYCPGLNTCLSSACASDDECDDGFICIVRGRIGICERGCTGPADCANMGAACMERVYPEDPRAICVQLPNQLSPPPPPERECDTDADCAESRGRPRCNGALGKCGCGGDDDCAANERCRCELGQPCPQ